MSPSAGFLSVRSQMRRHNLYSKVVYHRVWRARDVLLEQHVTFQTKLALASNGETDSCPTFGCEHGTSCLITMFEILSEEWGVQQDSPAACFLPFLLSAASPAPSGCFLSWISARHASTVMQSAQAAQGTV